MQPRQPIPSTQSAQLSPQDAPPSAAREPVVGTPHPQAAARSYAPILVFLAYTATLITGFGASLGKWQPVPIYIFCALLLLTLQETIAAHRSHGRFVYIFLTSAFAVLFAGDAVFHPLAKGNVALSAYTYLFVFAVVVGVYVWKVITRRMQHPDGLRGSLRSYTILAADFTGLALLLFGSAILLDFLGPHSILRFFGFHPGASYITVDLNQTLRLQLKPPLDSLQGASSVAGLLATAAVLLCFVIVGTLLPTGGQDAAGAPRLGFSETLRAIWRDVREQVSDALSVALAPLVWLVPAFAIAYFSRMVTDYLNRSAATTGTILDLFNPFSPISRESYGSGIATLSLALVAVATVALAVAVVERDGEVVGYGLRLLRSASRVVLQTWVIFVYSLAVINAIAILVDVTNLRPFQVGAPSLLSLIGALLLYWRDSRQQRQGTAGAPATT